MVTKKSHVNLTEQADKIFHILSKANPKPTTELKYTNDFTLLIAVVLSAHTTDLSVNKATQPLFELYDRPDKMLTLGEAGLKKYIQSIGLFNNKAKNIIALCKILITHYQGNIPNHFEELIKLPGVGRKTANVVLNCLYQRPTIAVDTHVFRVAKRLGLAYGQSPVKVEKELLQVVNKKWLHHAHHWLVLHGRYICKARKPNCIQCVLQAYCNYYKINQQ